VSWRKTGCLCMSKSRGIDYKHRIRRKNRPFWQYCLGRALRPTIATAEAEGRAQGRIGSRSSPIAAMILYIYMTLLSFLLVAVLTISELHRLRLNTSFFPGLQQNTLVIPLLNVGLFRTRAA
jgi:hypothetical protein